MGRASLGSIVLAIGCGFGRSHPTTPQSAQKRLAVLPAESDAFPRVAAELSKLLAGAHVAGVSDTEVSKVSLEVVQLSIECVDQTVACYAAVGKSLHANELLFAQLQPAEKNQLKVTVTLFDVDASAPTKTAAKVFASARQASAGLAGLVSEATSQ